MLRVGLTGGLGSGKSTVAAMLAEHGAHILSADEIARSLMQPATEVYRAIVRTFGAHVVLASGALDRQELARLAFTGGRIDELNAIIHPATLAEQQRLAADIAARDPHAILVVESALIFEATINSGEATVNSGETTVNSGEARPWRRRFDRLILVTAPEDLKIARFVARSAPGDPAALAAEARRRLARLLPDEQKAPLCDFLLHNTGSVDDLRTQVAALWSRLQAENT